MREQICFVYMFTVFDVMTLTFLLHTCFAFLHSRVVLRILPVTVHTLFVWTK